jgi:hypothetical protein
VSALVDVLAASSPVVRQLRKAGEASIPGARNLNQLLMTLRRTGGIDYLMDFILNASNTFNNYDEFGHILFAQLQITNCVEYDVVPVTGCDARWFDERTESSAPAPTTAPEADPIDPSLEADLPEEARSTKDLLNFLIGSDG